MILPIKNMMDAFCVKGLNVIVTGGNRGIGLGISQAYAQSGANVAILCRNKESGEKASNDLKQYNIKSFCVRCDTSSMESVNQAVDEVLSKFDRVDILVNNAGVSTVTKFLQDENLSEWHRVINTNLNGVAYMIYAVVPHMVKAARGGSVINISSIGGQNLGGARNHPMSPYHVSKAALDMFTKNMAIEFGDYDIRVNAIAPGPTHSDLDKDLPPQAFEMIEKTMPMHRFAEPIEVGALCVFLSSPAACQITGTVMVHDGGLVLGG
ncbi:MAG: SDR family oxidoreductase [Clostridiales bacterium]|jgi:NAD(P)-dependent dehydrogenase (short-subunit alcohol dehydrogenase family)|nr:SDR family oxidoreductase [Clostridiales bacterium]